VPFPYVFGYVHIGANEAASWRTVMAYNTLCSASFPVPPYTTGYCTRVQYFSNPDVNYSDGNPMGVLYTAPNSADNRRTINNTADTVANFRTEIPSSPPVAPSGLLALVYSSTQAGLSWTDNSDDEARFKIYRSVNGGAYAKIGTRGANNTTYNDSTVTQGNTYCYKVRGHNDAGNGPYSNESCTKISKPPRPDNLAVGFGSIEVTWSDNSMNETHFRLYRQLNGGLWVELTRPDRNETSYADTSVVTGPNTYCYRARAKNGMGYSNYSNTECLKYSKPAKPTGLDVVLSSLSRANLTWNDQATNETSFKVVRNVNGGANSTIASLGANTEAYADTTISQGNTYCWKVRAHNKIGYSNYTDTVCARSGKPFKPTNMASSVISANRVDLTWQDNAIGEDRFRLYRSVNGGAYAVIANLAENVESYSDTTVTAGNTYCWRIRAQNGLGYSNYSNVTCRTPS
jgi:fibronectin type 3 domain-containing protein